MSKKINEISPDFRTNDLYFAAYLQTAGAKMQKTEKDGSGKVYFVFDTSVLNLDELKAAWCNSTGRVPALPFSNAIKNLKSICHMA